MSKQDLKSPEYIVQQIHKISNLQPTEESSYIPIDWKVAFPIEGVKAHAVIPFPADGETAFHENAMCFDDWLGLKSQSGSSIESVMFRHVWDTVMMAVHQRNLGTPAHVKSDLLRKKYWLAYQEWLQKRGSEGTLLQAARGGGGLRTFDPEVTLFLDELCKHSSHLETKADIKREKLDKFDYTAIKDADGIPQITPEDNVHDKYNVVLQPMRKKGDPKKLGGFLLWIFVIDPRWSLDQGRTNVIDTIGAHANMVANKQFPASGGSTNGPRNLKLNADLQEIVATMAREGIATQHFTHPYWRTDVCAKYGELYALAKIENEVRRREEIHVCKHCRACLRRWNTKAHKACKRCWKTFKERKGGKIVETRRHVTQKKISFVERLGLSNHDNTTTTDSSEGGGEEEDEEYTSIYHARFRDFEKFTHKEAPDDGKRGYLAPLSSAKDRVGPNFRGGDVDAEDVDTRDEDDPMLPHVPKDRPSMDARRNNSKKNKTTNMDDGEAIENTEDAKAGERLNEAIKKGLRERTIDAYRSTIHSAEDAYNFCNLFTYEKAIVLAEYFGMDVTGSGEKICRKNEDDDDDCWLLKSILHPAESERLLTGDSIEGDQRDPSSSVYSFEKDYSRYDRVYFMIIDHFVWTNFEGTGLKSRYFPWVNKLESPWHKVVSIALPSENGRTRKRLRDYEYDSEEDLKNDDDDDTDGEEEEGENEDERVWQPSRKRQKRGGPSLSDPIRVHAVTMEPMLQRIAQEREMDTSALTLGGKLIRKTNPGCTVDGTEMSQSDMARLRKTRINQYSPAARKDEVTRIAETFAGWKRSFGFYVEIAREQIREKGGEKKTNRYFRNKKGGAFGEFERVKKQRTFYVPSKFSRDYYASVDEYEKTANFHLFRCMLKGSDSVLTEPFTEICRFFCANLLGCDASRGKFINMTVCHHYDPEFSIFGSHMQRRAMQVRWKCHIFFYWAEFLLIHYGLIGVYRHAFDLHPAFIITGDKAIGKSNLLGLLHLLLIKNTTKDKFAGSSKHNYADLSQSDWMLLYDELPPWVISKDGNRHVGFTSDADVNLQKSAMTLGFFVYYALGLWDVGGYRKARIPEAIFTPCVQTQVIIANCLGPNTIDAALRDRFAVLPLPDHLNHREDDDSVQSCEKISAAFYGERDGDDDDGPDGASGASGAMGLNPKHKKPTKKLAVKPMKYRDQIRTFQCKASGSSAKPDEQTVFDFSAMQCLHAVIEKMIAVGSLPSPDMSLLYHVLMRVVEHVEAGNSCSLAMGIRAFQSIGEEARSMVIEDAKLNTFFVNCRDRTRIDEKSIMDVKPYLWCQLHHAIFAITLQRNKIVDPYFSTVIFTGVSTICGFPYDVYRGQVKRLFQAYKKAEDETEEKMDAFADRLEILKRIKEEKEDREIVKRYKSAAILISLFIESLGAHPSKMDPKKAEKLYWRAAKAPEKQPDDDLLPTLDANDPGASSSTTPGGGGGATNSRFSSGSGGIHSFGGGGGNTSEKRNKIDVWNLNYVRIKIEASSWTKAKDMLAQDLQRNMDKDTKLSEHDILGIFEKMKLKMRVKVPYALEPCTHPDLVQFHVVWEKIKAGYKAFKKQNATAAAAAAAADAAEPVSDTSDFFFEDPVFDKFLLKELKNSLPSSFTGELPRSFPLFNVSFEKDNIEMPVIEDDQDGGESKKSFMFCFNIHATAHDARDSEKLLVEALRSIAYKGLRPRSKLLTGFVKGALNSGEFKTMNIDPDPSLPAFTLHASENPSEKIANILDFSQSIIDGQTRMMEKDLHDIGNNPSIPEGISESAARDRQKSASAIAEGYAEISDQATLNSATMYESGEKECESATSFVTKDLDDHFAEEWFVKAGIPMVYEAVKNESTGIVERVPRWLFRPEIAPDRPNLVELRPLPTEHNQRVRNLYHSWKDENNRAAIEEYHKNARLSKREIDENVAAYEKACREYESASTWLEEKVFRSSCDGGSSPGFMVSDREQRRTERTKPLYA